MTRLRNPGTGLVVSCEGDLAARYQAQGWVPADAVAQPAREAAPKKPATSTAEEPADEDKPVTRRSTRRK